MSLLKKHWQICTPNISLSEKLATELKISKITAQVLINRGIVDVGSAYKFLNPRLDMLSSPFEISDIKKAVERILLAKRKREKVVVYGDYDVDGVTGTSIVLLGLRKLGMDADYYIPHRYEEGYGLNEKAIKKLHAKNVKLIITVDCGISNKLEIEYANSLGMETIVTDHHNIPPSVPAAFAIVNPKLIEGNHPSKDLSGAGVAFKFIWALFKVAGIPLEELKDLLDLVALGTVSDIVPLIGENRILTVFGFKKLKENKRIGLKSLIRKAGILGEIGTREINFGLAPRLNAAGRIEHAELSVELLTAEDIQQADEIAEKLCRINARRQNIGANIGDEVREFLESGDEDITKSKLIFASAEGWHPGVIGIVAGRIAEEFYKPTILVSITEEGICRGSARSVENFNIYDLLSTCGDIFVDFGGHADAAGFEIKIDKLDELKKRLNKEVEGRMELEDLTPKINIDAEIEPLDMSMGLALELEALKPYGQKNFPPVFLKRKLRPINIRKVGDGSHLKIKFSGVGAILEFIGFGLGEMADQFSSSKYYDIAHSLELSQWNGYESVELKLIDAKEVN